VGQIIGELLPLALGIAISPVPIIAAILMLLSPRAKKTSIAFLGGWLLGIVVAVTIFALLSALIPPTETGASKPVAGVIKIVLGLGLLFLSFRQWRSRPAPGADAKLPKWMSAIDTMTAGRGLLLGFVLAAVNPKNLAMAIAAGLAIGATGASVGTQVLAIVIFTILAGSTVAIPVIGYLIASKQLRTPLENLRVWLVRNNATVMSVLLLVIGIVIIGKGIANF
jgi:threonine/homoserine/homoserine lactone efflux protein